MNHQPYFQSTQSSIKSHHSWQPTPVNQHSQLRIADPEKQTICRTCGTRYSSEKYRESECPVCLDDRQYVRPSGQQWISYSELMEHHTIQLKQHSAQLYEITTIPGFAIGQRAFFIQTDAGNILWDCIPLITQPIVDFIQNKGGLTAIAISHPHYYGLMNEWARAFQCPIYIHEGDKQWVMDSEENIIFWSGSKKRLAGHATLIHTGGHFPGSAALHTELNQLGGTLFTGDSLYLSRDRQHLSAMYSYPNLIPLTNAETISVFQTLSPYNFDAIFGAFSHQNIYEGGRKVFDASFNRYAFAFEQKDEV